MKRFNSAQFVFLILLFLILELVDFPILERVVQLLIPLTILVSFFLAGWTARFVAGLFLVAGASLLYRAEAAPVEYLDSFGEMLFVIAFFTVLPVLAIPIRLGGYDKSIMTLILQYARSPHREYAAILMISYFYGIFLNLAAVPMSYRSLQPLLHHPTVEHKERFLFFSMSQGFTTPLLWTPFSGMLGVTMISFGVDWISLVPVLMIISLLSLFTCYAIYGLWLNGQVLPVIEPSTYSTNTDDVHSSDDAAPSYLMRLAELVLVVALLLVAVFVMESRFELGLIISIIFLTFPFTIGWTSLKGQLGEFGKQLRDYYQHQIPRMSNIYMIFLSAGFFVGTVQITGTDALLSHYLLAALDAVPDWVVYGAMPWLIVGTSYMGIHPIVTLVLLTGSVNLMELGLSNEMLALAFLCGGVSTFLVSPFSGTVGLLKGYSDRSYVAIILWNLPTVLVIYMVCMGGILLMGSILGL